jgi:hypothetical protein
MIKLLAFFVAFCIWLLDSVFSDESIICVCPFLPASASCVVFWGFNNIILLLGEEV